MTYDARRTDRDALRALGAFVEQLEQPDFDFGRWVPARKTRPNAYTMGYYDFGAGGLEFLGAMSRLGWVRPGFDWGAWQQTPEGHALLTDHARVAEATEDELAKVMTVLVRGDRFVEGTLANAFESGLLAAIARRAGELAGG